MWGCSASPVRASPWRPPLYNRSLPSQTAGGPATENMAHKGDRKGATGGMEAERAGQSDRRAPRTGTQPAGAGRRSASPGGEASADPTRPVQLIIWGLLEGGRGPAGSPGKTVTWPWAGRVWLP